MREFDIYVRKKQYDIDLFLNELTLNMGLKAHTSLYILSKLTGMNLTSYMSSKEIKLGLGAHINDMLETSYAETEANVRLGASLCIPELTNMVSGKPIEVRIGAAANLLTTLNMLLHGEIGVGVDANIPTLTYYTTAFANTYISARSPSPSAMSTKYAEGNTYLGFKVKLDSFSRVANFGTPIKIGIGAALAGMDLLRPRSFADVEDIVFSDVTNMNVKELSYITL